MATLAISTPAPTSRPALEAADNGQLKAMVDLIARLQRAQFRQATAISENMLAAEADVQQVLGGLLDAAKQRQEKKLQDLRQVFSHAEALAADLVHRLQDIAPGVTTTSTSRPRASATTSAQERPSERRRAHQEVKEFCKQPTLPPRSNRSRRWGHDFNLPLGPSQARQLVAGAQRSAGDGRRSLATVPVQRRRASIIFVIPYTTGGWRRQHWA
jgi:hypothetical protein